MSSIVSLLQLRPGQRGRIVAIRGGRGVHAKLFTLGIHPGNIVRVVMASPWGGPIYIHNETTGVRVAINRGVAHKIFVEILR